MTSIIDSAGGNHAFEKSFKKIGIKKCAKNVEMIKAIMPKIM